MRILLLWLLLPLVSFSQEFDQILELAEAKTLTILEEGKPTCADVSKRYEEANTSTDSSLYYYSVAHLCAEFCNDLDLSAKISSRLAKELTKNGYFKESMRYYTLSLDTYRFLNDTLKVAETHKNIGTNYRRMSQFINGLKSLNKAAYIYHLAEDYEGMAAVDLSIGLIYKEIHDTRIAKEKHHKALKYYESQNNSVKMADCYNNLGNIFRYEKNMDSAIYYLQKTKRYRLKDGPELKLAFVYHNLANVHLDMGNFDSAFWYLDRSSHIKIKLNNYGSLTSDYVVYGELYTRTNNVDRAIESYENVRRMDREMGKGQLDYDLSLRLAKVYYLSGDYEESAENFMLYSEQLDSFRLYNNSTEVEDEFIRYEVFTDSLENEKMKLEAELEKQKTKNSQLEDSSVNSRFYFFFVIAILLIVMITLLLYSFRKRLKQAREHREVLAEQNEELKRTLISKEEKEILLKEIHHRVKNNLQIISSLIRLQSGFIDKSNYMERLKEVENRILSMALVHEKLYRSENLSQLKLKDYIKDLCINILESYQTEQKISFKFEIDRSEFAIDTLIPLGLILNETVSNSMKHAFKGKESGMIKVKLYEDADGRKKMVISDNGVGTLEKVEVLRENSLGMDLIFALTEQLDGELEIVTFGGFTYFFEFPALR